MKICKVSRTNIRAGDGVGKIVGEVFWNRNGSAVTFKAVTGKANLDVTWRDF